MRVARNERRSGHDLARLAVAALNHLPVEPGLLNPGARRCRADRLNRRDLGFAEVADGSDAGSRRDAVDMNSAGAAERHAAAELRAGQAQHVAQHPKERRVGVHIDGPIDAVDPNRDGHVCLRLFDTAAIERSPQPPIAARLVALFYNWWNIFVRLAEPDWHREAITSRPLLLHAIATRSRHARQTTLTIASSHAKSVPAAKALRAVAMFLRALAKTAEQLTASQRWAAILARAFQAFLNGRPLRLPPRLAPS